MEELQKGGILYHKILFIFFCIFINNFIFTQDFQWNRSDLNKSLKEYSSQQLFQLAQDNFKKGLYNNTIQYLIEYLERNPYEFNALNLIIKSFLNLNLNLRAKSFIYNGLNQYPEKVEFKIYNGLLYLQENNLQEVQKIIESLENNPNNNNWGDFLILKGRLYLKKGDYNLARYFFYKYLSYHPDDMNIYLNLIDYHLANQDFISVKEFIEKFKEQFPDNIEIYKLYGDYYYNQYLHNKKFKNHLENLEKSYLNYKTYLNYIDFNPQVWNHLLHISYLLNNKERIENLLSEYNGRIHDPILLSNISEYLQNKNLFDSLKNLCENNTMYFSCIRYDFFIKKNNKQLSNERSKKYLNFIKNNSLSFDEKYILLMWYNFLNPKNNLKEFLNFYKEYKYFEDYFITLQKLIIEEPDKMEWKLLMEKYLLNKDQYLMYTIFKNTPISNIKNTYKREKKTILIMNPFSLEKYEFHFQESELIRNFLRFLINNIEYLKTLEEDEWIELKSRILNDSKFYLFYQPEILPVIIEWEKEKNKKIDYILEIFYRISQQSIYLTMILRDSNGIPIQKENIQLTNKHELFLYPAIKDFLLNNISIESRYLANYNNDIVINAGIVDNLKKDNIFIYNNSYYRVKEIYPYTSILELIKGNHYPYTVDSIFKKISK